MSELNEPIWIRHRLAKAVAEVTDRRVPCRTCRSPSECSYPTPSTRRRWRERRRDTWQRPGTRNACTPATPCKRQHHTLNSLEVAPTTGHMTTTGDTHRLYSCNALQTTSSHAELTRGRTDHRTHGNDRRHAPLVLLQRPANDNITR